jgi:hypothetical protein
LRETPVDEHTKRIVEAIDFARYDTIMEFLELADGLICEAHAAACDRAEFRMREALRRAVRALRAACEVAGQVGTEGAPSNYE